MDSSQYMGIFGSHDDSYLLPNFLDGGIPMPSMGDHHHPKFSSNESSPSYESLNGSLPSSGGSPYDSHSPAEAPEHLDGARHSSISPTSGSFGDFQMTAFHQGGPNRQQHPSAGAPQALYAGWKASQAVMPPQAPELPKVLYGPPSVQPPYGMQNLGSHLPIAPEISQQPVLYSSGAYQRQNAAQQTYPPWMFPQANMANMSSQPAQTTAQPPPPPPPEQQLKRRRVASAAGPSEPTACECPPRPDCGGKVV